MSINNLIAVCGPSAAGKTTVARLIHKQLSQKVAYFDHDYFRETIFGKGKSESRDLRFNIILQSIMLTLSAGWDVIYDTTLANQKLSEMLDKISKNSDVKIHKFYLDVSLEESKIRHNNRPQSAEFSADALDDWYKKFIINKANSIVIDQDLSPQAKADLIIKSVYGK